MTRQEWFDNQTPEVQQQFKHNTNKGNEEVDFFDFWINQSVGATEGIGGAFVFSDTPEGHRYWMNINHKSYKQIDYNDEE
jgi:hypothetical protein